MNLSDGNNKFACDIYQTLKKEKKGNLFYSPFSISLALAMAYAGAKGQTRKQMADALHFELPSVQLHSAFRKISRSLKEIDISEIYGDAQVFKLNLANSIWGQEGYSFNPDFLNLLLKYYGTGLKLHDFKRFPEDARQEINRWVSKITEDKIRDLIPAGGIDSLTRLVLANAIYFYAGWAFPFGENSTHDGEFFLLSGDRVEVSMMENVEHFEYLKGNGFRAVRLPYVGGRISMVIILPEIERFSELENRLDVKFLNRILSRVKQRKVKISLPKFSFDSTFSLRDTLISLGMTDVFSDKADFSGMEDTQELYIHNVFHKAFIDVDEKGTEAAAATAVPMAVSAYGFRVREKVYRFKADHPFIFLVRDSESGSILFQGRVLDP